MFLCLVFKCFYVHLCLLFKGHGIFQKNYGDLVYALYHGHSRNVDSHPFRIGCFGRIDEEDGHRCEAVMHS